MKNKNGAIGAVVGILLLALVFFGQEFLNPPDNDQQENQQSSQQSNQQPASSGDYLRVLSARVTNLADGDSFTCLVNGKETRVRMFGIDSPERQQPHYEDARNALRAAIQDKTVELRVVDVDQYERQVARVILPATDGREEIDVNRQQIAQGWAWWYRTYAPAETDLAEAEEAAKMAGRGIWANGSPTPPWEFRRRQREGR